MTRPESSLEKEVPLTTIRDLYTTRDGFDRQCRLRAAEIGWTSTFISESLGGGSLRKPNSGYRNRGEKNGPYGGPRTGRCP